MKTKGIEYRRTTGANFVSGTDIVLLKTRRRPEDPLRARCEVCHAPFSAKRLETIVRSAVEHQRQIHG